VAKQACLLIISNNTCPNIDSELLQVSTLEYTVGFFSSHGRLLWTLMMPSLLKPVLCLKISDETKEGSARRWTKNRQNACHIEKLTSMRHWTHCKWYNYRSSLCSTFQMVVCVTCNSAAMRLELTSGFSPTWPSFYAPQDQVSGWLSLLQLTVAGCNALVPLIWRSVLVNVWWFGSCQSGNVPW
jgi:hypothetical protein